MKILVFCKIYILSFTILNIISLEDFNSCNSDSYYDLSSYECKSCPENEVPSIDSKYIIYIYILYNKLFQELSCVCDSLSIISYLNNEETDESIISNLIKIKSCIRCPSGQVASRNHKLCMGCSEGISESYKDCICQSGYVIIEQNSETGEYLDEKICKECPEGTYPGESTNKGIYNCAPCEYGKIYNKNTIPWRCECDINLYSEYGGECLNKDEANFLNTQFPTASASSVTMVDSEVALSEINISESDPISYLYLKSGFNCLKSSDIKSCQTLANLCVLHIYDFRKIPCSLFKFINDLLPSLPNKK